MRQRNEPAASELAKPGRRNTRNRQSLEGFYIHTETSHCGDKHSHGKLKPATRQYDVGVDAWEFRPVTLETIRTTRRRRTTT
jgi:calcineurin-like phosphoesterase family protein